ncbi:uncharacterized protein LOC131233851 isoform X1 [Magnolia sinica]|uniref:uncharacterized protein LOC131233851 isoform X1 n=1 Tax=Magnolia sinica TaxID=86752 RepID=UPI00265ACC09|nr:uncharacterized protein LOC131233851 isoform X1 [Magnolia sinica]
MQVTDFPLARENQQNVLKLHAHFHLYIASRILFRMMVFISFLFFFRLFNVYVRSLLSSKIHTCCQVPIWIWQLWSQILNQQKYYIWKTMREDMMSLLWHNFKDMVPLATIPVVIDKSIVGP